MFSLVLVLSALTAQEQAEAAAANKAAEAARAAALEAGREARDATEASKVAATASFFLQYPLAKTNKSGIDAAVLARRAWEECIASVVESWKQLDEPSKTILDAAFYQCRFYRVHAQDAYTKVLTIPGISNPAELTTRELQNAEDTLRLEQTAIVLSAKVAAKSYQPGPLHEGDPLPVEPIHPN